MEPFEVALTHNGYLISHHENISEAIAFIDMMMKPLRKLKPKKILQLGHYTNLVIIYELTRERKEMFYIQAVSEND